MTASPQLVREARRLQHQAVEQLLEVYYPQVYRMAYGLCGRVSAGRTALRLVMIQCLRVLPVWQRDQTPEYWFSHHTLLACRHAAQRLPDPRNDLLVQLAQTQDPTYIAFVQAVRALPLQQREAFILHHGEKFSLRQLGIAMDCSVDAASHHLHAASLALIPVSDGRMDELARELARAYARLTPGETVVLPAVHEYMRRHYWPRRVLRMVHWILTLPGLWLMLAAAAGYAWMTGGVYLGVRALAMLLALALAAEIIEFLAGSAGAKRAGGGRWGMVGALLGGLVGGIFLSFLLPIPILGTLVGVCLGAFLGGSAGELAHGREMAHSVRVGVGAAKGRFLGIVIKLAFGVGMFLIAAWFALPFGAAPAPTAPFPTPATAAATQPAPASTQSTRPGVDGQ